MKGLDYESAGIRGLGKDKSRKNFELLEASHKFAKGPLLQLPFNTLYPVGGSLYHTKCSDGVGTKVLLAELAGKHDTIGIDAVAMVANDCIRCGATPLALTNTIDATDPSESLVSELMTGLLEGAMQAQVPMVAGETASLPDIFKAGYIVNCDIVGEVAANDVIDGKSVAKGDCIIGLRSSGLHSNGITLARKALFKKWGGKYDAMTKPPGMERELVLECLEPTKIYVKEFAALRKKVRVKAAVHITGDAYAKFSHLGAPLGFEFDHFEPQEIFFTIQKAGNVSSQEMFKRFNMGWGFAVIVAEADVGGALKALGKDAAQIGRVTDSRKVIINYKKKELRIR
jgi:phosphoribosylformylglycinamidine cyclo-ligase